MVPDKQDLTDGSQNVVKQQMRTLLLCAIVNGMLLALPTWQ